MILGGIADGEHRVRITERILCSNCSKEVPGGITIPERILGTPEFYNLLKEFKISYLCGTCRDSRRVAKRSTKVT